MKTLIQKLDLQEHVGRLESFFARPHPLPIPGDQERHYRMIQALDLLRFPPTPKSIPFESLINHLKRHGVLSFEQIYEVVKVVRYFRTLQREEYEGPIGEWMAKILIPDTMMEVMLGFDHEGRFIEDEDALLVRLNTQMKETKTQINDTLKRLVHTQKLTPYLVDTQIHWIHEEECMLVRGGFHHVLKGSIVGRTAGGFFYVVPESVQHFKAQLRHYAQEREAQLYQHAKRYSSLLAGLVPFIGFVDREFDRWDHYQARVVMAREGELSIVRSYPESTIVLEEFAHPALHQPTPISIQFRGSILMITGVNAGGKTMMLKSLLSAAWMAKYLIPMKVHPHRSRIGSFKRIEAVIDDPQNVRNDISTFAGRMVQFAHLFGEKQGLIGVDEIELGTDSDEAAALFAVVLGELIQRGQKIIITTHHKRLAALMADREDVELLAALYDEERRRPTYHFLEGVIGKSYAFETAERYGIAEHLVARARQLHGENHAKLNLLIERGSELERTLKHKHRELDRRLEALTHQETTLKEAKETMRLELDRAKAELHHQYDQAIHEAKLAAKEMDQAAIHRQLNKAQKALPKTSPVPSIMEHTEPRFEVGQGVKYRHQRGTIVSVKEKEATIEVEGMRLRVRLRDLKVSGNLPKVVPVRIHTQVEQKGGLTLDLHGLRADEACERLDKFLSDALIQGFDEVLIYHGIGTGKLAYAVKEFLKAHPRIKGFGDAPASMGGFGAKVVQL